MSSESERKQREKKGERKPKTKKDKIKIGRTEICKVEQSKLPDDAEFRGYETIVVHVPNVAHLRATCLTAGDRVPVLILT